MPDIWGIAASTSKFALYLGILTAAGSVIMALAFRLEAYRRAAVGFASIGILAALLAFSLRGALLTGDASGMFDLEMLALLWGTPIGTALAYRLIGLGLLILGLFMGRKGLWLALFGGILALWSFDHVGHIPDRDSVLLNIALTFHLIAIAFWIGILMPLKRLASQKETWAQAADIGHRFGQYASVVVPLLIVAGGYMGYHLVGSISALLTTGYGQALLLKILLVTILLGLAAANKLRFIPKLRARDENAAHHLVQSIRIEWIVILCVLGVTAVLTSNLTLPM
ncbi:copper resistance D family protein [Planktotalea sp.]|uniref:copper resistance D family protein n=1 Tax=Planktotalea sp. TaxID=2029877 RepID=UPI003D6A4852